jgi:DUF4097 and DUF4098 domain-containing protein YvlB
LTVQEGEVKKGPIALIVAILAVIAVMIVVGVLLVLVLLPFDEVATDTKNYSGSVTADEIYLETTNPNGRVSVSTWASSEYKIDVDIEATGTSKKDAEAHLNELRVNLDENVVQNQLRLILELDAPTMIYDRLTIYVDVFLPATATIDLDLTLSNGRIHLTEIIGGEIDITTSNGQILLDGVEAEDLKGTTSNGAIDGVLPCTFNGNYTLTTSNGVVGLKVSSSSDVGYDFVLSTSNGDVDVTLSDISYTLDDSNHKIGETNGFSGKAVQIGINASSSNGYVSLGTS